MDLQAYLTQRKNMVDAALEAAMPQTRGLAEELVKSMRYSLFAGGKRLRSILCLAAAEAVGGSLETAMPAAVTLEMIHTYSLIHDDLPSMDNDDLRRGRPTNHKVFGEALAILAGDGLMAEGLAVLARAGVKGLVKPELALAALDVIIRATSSEGMVAGQVVDILSEGVEVDEATVMFIHTHKTGALITASVTSGAILGGGDDGMIKSLNRYGRRIGLAFQIIDDILDIEGDPGEMGKYSGMDEARGKATYPSVIGQSRSLEVARELVNEGTTALADFGPEADPLREIAKYLLTRQK